ncbi:MAG: SDR family oxidoreductase [Pseudomonadota bacterium]
MAQAEVEVRMETKLSNLDGKVAFITGGGTGIGRATAMMLVEQGSKVVIAGRREAPLAATVAESPDNMSYVQLDLADWDAQQHALDTVLERHGRLDILINNAAMSICKPFADHSVEDIASVTNLNLTSTAVLTHKALEHIIKFQGNIINVSSAAGKYTGMPPQLLSCYGASKAGLNHFTRLLATELGPQGVRVNAVSPGFTDTEIAADAFSNPELVEAVVSVTPLGRAGQPEDVARVICFLASGEAQWVTGQIVDATGGYCLAL